MHKVKYTKAKAAFWGVEHLNKAKKKQASVIRMGKDAAERVGKKTAFVLNPDEDEGLRRWKQEVIYGKGGSS